MLMENHSSEEEQSITRLFQPMPQQEEGPPLPLLAEDVEALERMLRLFRAALRRRLPASRGRDMACEQIGNLQQKLARALLDEASGGRWLAREELKSLGRTMQMLQIFLFLLIPSSEERQRQIDALWQVRERLGQLQRDRAHLN
ncbi:MAG: hypothetical protein IMW89_14685 [Ktedonobacteraceae bacterium]|nr:hypothetical protein [Ktedonobacteraceae bacterium]